MPTFSPRTLALATVLALAACGGSQKTYYKDVEPIVQTKCGGCHVPGGIAPFTLTSYADVKSRAKLVDDQTQARLMPPWPPGPGSLPFEHDRSLSDAQVATIHDWVAAGSPEGDKKDHQDRSPEVVKIRKDASIAMAEEYTPAAGMTDDYRCFVIDPQLADSQYLTGYEVHPGVPAIVHHVILYQVQDVGDAFAQLDALDAADPGPGYTCFGGPQITAGGGGAKGAVRFLGGWAPGTGAVPLPAGTGLAMPAHSRIVMQLHYNTFNGRFPDLTTADLQYTHGSVNEAYLVPLANTSFQIQPGDAHAVVTDDTFVNGQIPNFTLYGVYPHMHLHGRQISMSVTQGGKETTLIDIPRWNFHWQGQYHLTTPIRVKQGDHVGLTCVFDNSLDSQPIVNGQRQDPQILTWGERTTDEMCLGFVYLSL